MDIILWLGTNRDHMKSLLKPRVEPQIEDFRRMLIARREEVASGVGMRFGALASVGRVAEEDQAQVYHEEFLSVSLNTLDYQQLGLVEEALDRIKCGDYGSCQECGRPIPRKRLRIIPWARYCIECQQRAVMEYGS